MREKTYPFSGSVIHVLSWDSRDNENIRKQSLFKVWIYNVVDSFSVAFLYFQVIYIYIYIYIYGWSLITV